MEEFYNSNLNEGRVKEMLEYINKRWKQLQELSKERSEDCINYLFLCNGGGVAACFNAINTSTNGKDLSWVKLCGAIFLIGLVFVGFLKLKIFWHCRDLFDNWQDKTSEFFKQKISFQMLNEQDDKLVDAQDVWLYSLGYASLICFLLACILGIYFSQIS